MTWSLDDVSDAVADRCIEQHTELHTDCAYCQTRADLKYCARCEDEVWPHKTCPNHRSDEGSLLVDGFGQAIVTLLPAQGVAAA